MRELDDFTACLWDTTGLRGSDLELTRTSVWRLHPAGGVVETCQRIEAFSLTTCHCDAPRRLRGVAAAEHLSALAAGLESAVLGEYQVLGQVRAGLAPLRSQAPWLDAVIAGARALRAEAAFVAGTGQLLDAALALAERDAKGSLLVIGAGAAGRDVARRGRALGFCVTVASRREWLEPGIWWAPFGEMTAAHADVVVSCLSSGVGELAPAQLPRAALYVDLGSPPNLGPDVAPAISLETIVRAARSDAGDRARRDALRRRLNAILAERLDANTDRPAAVARLRREAESVRAREAARIARLHPALSHTTIETITRALVNQLLHVPSERLRKLDDSALADRLAELFTPEESAR